MAPIRADDAEAAALVQREAGRVLGEDAGDELPEPALGVGVGERREGGPSGAGATAKSKWGAKRATSLSIQLPSIFIAMRPL